jgi:hypothetical protein
MECVARIDGPLTNGIRNLAFSNDDSNDAGFIAASGMDDDHSIAVYKWVKPTQSPTGQASLTLIATGKGLSSAIWSLGFNNTGEELVATGTKEVMFYEINKDWKKA